MLFAKDCAPGAEQWETFKRKGKVFVQYDYRDPSGVLFSCVKGSLEECRKAAVAWQKKNENIIFGVQA